MLGGGDLTAPRRTRVELEASPDDVDLVPMFEAFERGLESALAQVTPWAHDVVRITSSHGLDPYIATGRFKHSEPPAPAPRGPVPKNATPKQLMARKTRTAKGRAVYARRKAIVEPVFGQMDTVQNARRLLLRGKQAARDQWRFHCAIHNLLKLHRNGGLALLTPG
jgi:hypothetical protein